MPIGWRIVAERLADNAFSGEGARLNGGRWNSPGVGMVYIAQSISLAQLELLVHIGSFLSLEPFVLFPVRFDESLLNRLDYSLLPANWKSFPFPMAVQNLGDDWIRSELSVVLQVPSAVVEEESNYLINPAHADFARLEIGPAKPMMFDSRLIR